MRSRCFRAVGAHSGQWPGQAGNTRHHGDRVGEDLCGLGGIAGMGEVRKGVAVGPQAVLWHWGWTTRSGDREQAAV